MGSGFSFPRHGSKFEGFLSSVATQDVTQQYYLATPDMKTQAKDPTPQAKPVLCDLTDDFGDTGLKGLWER